MNIVLAFQEARRYEDWVLRKAPLSKLNAAERSMRRKYQSQLADMMKKYGPVWEAIFKKG